MSAPAQAFRLHFTDAAMAQVQELGLDQDAVRTALHQGSKQQLGENRVVSRHLGIEVEAETLGQDYEVLRVRKEPPWPRQRATLRYLDESGKA